MSFFPTCLEDFDFFDGPMSDSDKIHGKTTIERKSPVRGDDFSLGKENKEDTDVPDVESVAASSLASYLTYGTNFSGSTEDTDSTDSSVNSELTFGSNTIQEKYNNALDEVAALRSQMTWTGETSHRSQTSSHTEVARLRAQFERMQKADATAREQLEMANKALQRRLRRALSTNNEKTETVKEKMKKELSTRKARSNALSKRLGMEIAARRATEEELEKMTVKMEGMEREIKRLQGRRSGGRVR